MAALGVPAVFASTAALFQKFDDSLSRAVNEDPRAKIIFAELSTATTPALASQQALIENPPAVTGALPLSPVIDAPTPVPEIAPLPPSVLEITPPPPPGPEASATHPRSSVADENLSVVTKPPQPEPSVTPASLLRLEGKERTRHEKCLANAIYFESRGEPVRGQIAVAQVVMNRVFSPYYPKDVCGVVYQNAERHLSCQFTFACDGKSKAINDRGAWARAQRIARLTLDGKVWLSAVAKSTHYHAYWVNPAWVAEMKKTFNFGVHSFYRPHRWGDGSKEAGWVFSPLPAHQPVTSVAQTKPAVVTQPTPTPANSKAKVVPASAQVNAKATAQAIDQPKLQPSTNKTKPAPINNQTKPSPTKPSATNSQTKPLPASSELNPAQKISAH